MAALPVAGAAAHPEGAPLVVDLLADGRNDDGDPPIDVGDVEVWNDGTNLHVDYVIDTGLADAWCITKTHVAVEEDSEDIPQTRKNDPIPGKFEFTDTHDCVTEFGYTIPVTWAVGTKLAIAAHANVEIPGGLDELELALPATATLSVTFPFAGGPSYFPTSTISNGGGLNGTYEGWCVDTDRSISQNTLYTVNVYSSYETLPAGTVEFPENLDLVNWIINQGFVGTDAGGGDGTYTYGDVQRAIWALVEDENSFSGIGATSPARVAKILAAAGASGEGFEPGCGDVVAVILVPVSGMNQITIAQVTFAEVGVPCETRAETAWAGLIDEDGVPQTTFPGKNWATWFEYTIQA